MQGAPQSPIQSQPQPQPQPQQRRRRPALSCSECRRRKIRCDHTNPCGHCVRHKTQCTYKLYLSTDPNPRPGQQPRPESQQLEGATSSLPTTASPPPSLHRSSPHSPFHNVAQSKAQQAPPPRNTNETRPTIFTENLQVLGEPISWPQVTAATATTSAAVPNTAPTPVSLGRSACDSRAQLTGYGPDTGGLSVRDLLQRIQKLEDASKSQTGASPSLHASSETSRESVALHSPAGVEEWQVVFNKTRDLGKSGWMGTAQEFAVIIACYSEIIGKESEDASLRGPEVSEFIVQASDYLRRCKSRALSIKIGRPTRGLSSPGFGLQLPSREVADAMVNLYFASFESTYRIVHVPTFWTEYWRYWDHPESVPDNIRLKVLLVIGIGSSLHDHGDADAALSNREMVQQWIYAAQTWLSGPLEKNRLDIAGLQIYCLTILARQIFSLGGDTVWISVGSLMHMAMQIGLHRDPKHLRAISVLQGELRRRLWITILEFVVQSSLDASMPPRISFDEFDTEPPSNINDEELDESTIMIQPHPKSTFTTMSIQLAMVDSLQIRFLIVQALNSLHSEPSYSRVLSLTSALTEALRTSSNVLKDNDSVTPFHRNLLDYLVRRYVIPLNYVYSNQARINPIYRQSLKLSLDAAMAIISPEPDDGFARLIATGGGMFREGVRCALTAVSLELLTHVETQRLDGTLQRTREYRELLKQAVRDLIRLSEERIRLGETNVKSYMFLSMILAQVEAVEAGGPVALQVARSARDSLQFCHDLLRSRADQILFASPADAGSVIEEDGRLDVFGLDFDWQSFLPDAYI